MAGVSVPLQPVKHQYIITEKIDGRRATRRPSATRPRPISGKRSAPGHGGMNLTRWCKHTHGDVPTIGSLPFDDDWIISAAYEPGDARVPALAPRRR